MQIIRYCATGLANTATYASLTLFLEAKLHWTGATASCLAYEICVVMSYSLQRWLVFRSNSPVTKQLAGFILLGICGCLAATAITAWMTDYLHWMPWIAILTVTAVMTLINYTASSRILFKT